MNDLQKKALLALARSAIAQQLGLGELDSPQDKDFSQKRGLFVSLHSGGELRGCIGYIKAYKSIKDSIIEMAVAAAFRDPRFPPLHKSEMEKIAIEISLLSEMILVKEVSEVEIGRDGLYLIHPHGSGLLLPQVAVEWNWDRATFLQQVCRKAGLKSDAYKDPGVSLFRFSAEIFGEDDSF